MSESDIIVRQMRVLLCGGGNMSHALACLLPDIYSVSVCTRRPEEWSHTISPIIDRSDGGLSGIHERGYTIEHIGTADYFREAGIIPQFDIIILCSGLLTYTYFAENILKYARDNTLVIVIPGSLFTTLVRHEDISRFDLVLTLRVPYICRTENYGHAVHILGKAFGRQKCCVVPSAISTISNDYGGIGGIEGFGGIKGDKMQAITNHVTNILGGEIEVLNDEHIIDFSGANNILHTSRLYASLRLEDFSPDQLYGMKFYGDWDIVAAELLYECDMELHRLSERCGIRALSITNHYHVNTPEELCQKIRSIKSLSLIKFPLSYIYRECRFNIDWNNRYFVEDGLYKLGFLVRVANNISDGKAAVEYPALSRVYEWISCNCRENGIDIPQFSPELVVTHNPPATTIPTTTIPTTTIPANTMPTTSSAGQIPMYPTPALPIHPDDCGRRENSGNRPPSSRPR